MKILTAAQMGDVDRLTTEECGLPSATLMENAGFHLYLALEAEFDNLLEQKIAIICGKGNNGGDGMVLARQLAQRGMAPDLLLLARADDISGDAGTNLQVLLKSGVPVFQIDSETAWEEVAPQLDLYDILVDGILGTGITKPLKGFYARVVEDINESDAFVLSIDIPSGMVSDAVEAAPLSVWADHTVTFTAPKIAHLLNEDQEALGRVSIVPIGTPPHLLDRPDFDLSLLTLEEVTREVIPRRAGTHKGNYGHVSVIAGSLGKTGAAGLTSLGALRAGSGLVTVFTPESVLPIVAGYQPEVMTRGFPETDSGTFAENAAEDMLAALENLDAAALGPGLTTHPETVKLVHRLVREGRLPLVVDADGLNAIAKDLSTLKDRRGSPLVLTPHPGEFARLIDASVPEVLKEQLHHVRGFCREYNVWLILKTFRPLIGTPEGHLFVSPRGNPGMATAGMGDVLTGVVLSLLGRFASEGRTDPDDFTRAVSLAVYLHGMAGDFAAEENGQESLIAGDLIDYLGDAYEELLDPAP